MGHAFHPKNARVLQALGETNANIRCAMGYFPIMNRFVATMDFVKTLILVCVIPVI